MSKLDIDLFTETEETECTVKLISKYWTPFLRKDGYFQFNGFRDINTYKIDKVYLRTAAVYRLLSRQKINFDRAVELLKFSKEDSIALISSWKANGLRHLVKDSEKLTKYIDDEIEGEELQTEKRSRLNLDLFSD